MPISFTTSADTGADTVASIQPITNGEPVNQTTLRRPSENLRVRTETLKTAALALEVRETEDAGAFVYTEGGSCSIENAELVDRSATGVPLVVAKQFLLNDATLVVVSPAIPGGKIVLKASDFTGFYSEGVDGDHCLIKRGDCIALKMARSGANTRASRTWGNDHSYQGVADGNIGSEAELVKLPSRVVLNTPGQTLLTTLGGLVDADTGVPSDPLYASIVSVAGQASQYWSSIGGRGDIVHAGTPRLEVSRVTDTTIEVISTEPWRVLWPAADGALSWVVNNAAGDPVVSGGSGYITAKDFSDYHIIPLVTYTGTGYVFSPNGGFLPELAERVLSFSLPVSDVLDLASTDAADEGTAAIGSKLRSSSGDVDAAHVATNGGVQLSAATLSDQIDLLVKKIAQRPRVMTRFVDTYPASGTALFDVDEDGRANISSKERIVQLWFEIEEEFSVSSGTLTLSIGAYNLLAQVRSLTGGSAYDLLTLPVGRYEIPSANFRDYSPTLISGSGPKLKFKILGTSPLSAVVTAGKINVVAYVREVP